ncbi:uncharacterized protein JN550_008523 [Neoarthrinium moseri]|uniref:uncharacterized protein n=1 Tax=Neoarthrinium moseri TaxID=1658444 RepID=UPI001FDB8996|nr:uncharacterized protein JN550_008523 [Neoarthrinium moseri]KAI1864977.1 hypothetical protein JN550_008523 [Neoarthrinium moseri]
MCRLFEILNTPQSGSGAFATRDIPVGTEQVLELSSYRPVRWVSQVDQALDLIMSRSGRSPDTREQYLQLWFATRTNSFIEDDAGYRSRIPDKSFPNLFSLAITQVALFTVASRFNHSCAHNALHAVEAGFIELRARCDIRKGKEITLTYIDPWVEDRAAQLERSWGFRCCCPICDESNTTMSPEVRGNYEKMFN